MAFGGIDAPACCHDDDQLHNFLVVTCCGSVKARRSFTVTIFAAERAAFIVGFLNCLLRFEDMPNNRIL